MKVLNLNLFREDVDKVGLVFIEFLEELRSLCFEVWFWNKLGCLFLLVFIESLFKIDDIFRLVIFGNCFNMLVFFVCLFVLVYKRRIICVFFLEVIVI